MGWLARIRDFERTADGTVFYVVEIQAPGINENGKILLWSVNRRYSQFAALRKALRSLHPISILPPLPNKTDVVSAFQENLSRRKRLTNHAGSLQLIDHIVSSGRLDARLIDYRCRALQYFLQHVLLHRQSPLAAVIQNFLKDADVSEKLRETAVSIIGLDVISVPVVRTQHAVPSTVKPEMQTKQSSINSQLLTNRAASLRVAYSHLWVAQRRVLKRCTHFHRLHKNYAEALCQWCPHEAKSVVIADAFQIAGHELDGFSSLMDTAEEEEAELMEKYDFLARYADSLEEMQEAYQTVQTNSSRRSRTNWSPHKTIEGTIDSFAPPSGPERQSVNVPETSKHTVGATSACMDVLWETLHFESVHQSDLNELFYAYACLQLRRAERCKRMWERVMTSLQLAAEGISLSRGN
ncbi:hypothetical protein FGIG_08576 [Fasciola gigantica]|uniref:PX domain-containing protein n=1 Tax=Fasciola gigantica TaxID=46835 RepID=A0A504Z364_FASGI|nr:hypothetical protein FGIG_08576 [Fasciola gigantica]